MVTEAVRERCSECALTVREWTKFCLIRSIEWNKQITCCQLLSYTNYGYTTIDNCFISISCTLLESVCAINWMPFGDNLVRFIYLLCMLYIDTLTDDSTAYNRTTYLMIILWATRAVPTRLSMCSYSQVSYSAQTQNTARPHNTIGKSYSLAHNIDWFSTTTCFVWLFTVRTTHSLSQLPARTDAQTMASGRLFLY